MSATMLKGLENSDSAARRDELSSGGCHKKNGILTSWKNFTLLCQPSQIVQLAGCAAGKGEAFIKRSIEEDRLRWS
jgi:hypothetical protein